MRATGFASGQVSEPIGAGECELYALAKEDGDWNIDSSRW